MAQVSVIVPNFNHAPFLRKRLKSILNQSFSDFEIIILDDASTDSSKEIIEDYRLHPKVTHIEYNNKNSGSSFKQWHKGIELAKGELIWIAESDDYNDSGFLEKMVELADCHVNGNLFASNLVVVDKDDQVTGGKTKYTSEVITGSEAVLNLFGFRNYIWNASSVVFRHRAAKSVPWETIEKMKFCGDWQFYVSILLEGDLVTTSENLSYFRMHQQTVTSSPDSRSLHFEEGLSVVTFIINNSKISWTRKLNLCSQWLYMLFKSVLQQDLDKKYRSRIRYIFGNTYLFARFRCAMMILLYRLNLKL